MRNTTLAVGEASGGLEALDGVLCMLCPALAMIRLYSADPIPTTWEHIVRM